MFDFTGTKLVGFMTVHDIHMIFLMFPNIEGRFVRLYKALFYSYKVKWKNIFHDYWWQIFLNAA